MKIDFRNIQVKDIEGNNSTVDIATNFVAVVQVAVNEALLVE